MQAHTSLIAELEDAVHGGSSHKRAAVLARITDLFVEGTKRFDDEQIGAFDDVLGYLIDKIETKALAELSQRLAKLDHAPPRVLRRLAAHDEIAVAGPVLRHSKQLDDDNLVSVAKAGSQDHLLAISVRSRVNEPVTTSGRPRQQRRRPQHRRECRRPLLRKRHHGAGPARRERRAPGQQDRSGGISRRSCSAGCCCRPPRS